MLLSPNRNHHPLRQSLRRSAAVVVALAVLQPAAHADPNQYLEMFLDDVNVWAMTGGKRQINQPTRNPNPVITGAHGTWNGSWDNSRSFGTVIFDEQENIFKAWYQNNDARNGISYATSTNGVAWTYPESPTKPNTNILFRGEGAPTNLGASYKKMYNASVIKDLNETDPTKLYKMVYYDHDKGRAKDANGDYIYFDGTHPNGGSAGIYTATSSDGLNWDRSTTPQLDIYRLNENSIHDVVEMMYDSQNDKYVIYSKALAQYSNAATHNGAPAVASANDHRVISRSESSDFVNWSTPQVVLRHDNTLEDPQSYGSSVFEYEGIYIMPLRIYNNTGLANAQQGDHTIDVQLAASRDGINWTRVADKSNFMDLGADGTFDDGMILPYRPFEKDGEIWTYYQAWNGPHENPDGSSAQRTGTVGLGKTDAGRFVAITPDTADPEIEPAILITETFEMTGNGLYLNAELSDTSDIRIIVLDDQYQSLGSLGWAASQPGEVTAVSSNPLYYSVSFAGMADFDTAFEDEVISLKFVLYNDAKLYGYTTTSTVLNPEPSTLGLVTVPMLLCLRRRNHMKLASA